jgi:anti-anti-sigma factor
VSFVDSSGLGVLVGTYKRLREDGNGSIKIVGAQASVRKVFEITGLESALLQS